MKNLTLNEMKHEMQKIAKCKQNQCAKRQGQTEVYVYISICIYSRRLARGAAVLLLIFYVKSNSKYIIQSMQNLLKYNLLKNSYKNIILSHLLNCLPVFLK